jgi:hypothetical protein
MDRREQYAGNENRAKHSASLNPPSDCSSLSRPASPGAMPPPIRGDAPVTSDPHFHGRLSTDNATVRPPERPRSHYAAEDRRRLNPRSGDTYK